MPLPLVDHSDRFLVSFFTDIEDMISILDQFSSFSMYFIYEWTSGIDPAYLPRSKSSEITRTTPMCRYDKQGSFWNFRNIRFKYYSSFLKHTNDEIIMDDLMIHINSLIWIVHDDLHKHIDRTMDSCTVSTWIGHIDGK